MSDETNIYKKKVEELKKKDSKLKLLKNFGFLSLYMVCAIVIAVAALLIGTFFKDILAIAIVLAIIPFFTSIFSSNISKKIDKIRDRNKTDLKNELKKNKVFDSLVDFLSTLKEFAEDKGFVNQEREYVSDVVKNFHNLISEAVKEKPDYKLIDEIIKSLDRLKNTLKNRSEVDKISSIEKGIESLALIQDEEILRDFMILHKDTVDVILNDLGDKFGTTLNDSSAKLQYQGIPSPTY